MKYAGTRSVVLLCAGEANGTVPVRVCVVVDCFRAFGENEEVPAGILPALD